tara:strand:- start:2816 stop:3079 length:264 start_codon:yes stop_codon:yes gene_type:complete
MHPKKKEAIAEVSDLYESIPPGLVFIAFVLMVTHLFSDLELIIPIALTLFFAGLIRLAGAVMFAFLPSSDLEQVFPIQKEEAEVKKV